MIFKNVTTSIPFHSCVMFHRFCIYQQAGFGRQPCSLCSSVFRPGPCSGLGAAIILGLEARPLCCLSPEDVADLFTGPPL